MPRNKCSWENNLYKLEKTSTQETPSSLTIKNSTNDNQTPIQNAEYSPHSHEQSSVNSSHYNIPLSIPTIINLMA